MDTSNELYCEECEAVYFVRHDMDDEVYTLSFCPYCGEEIEDEEIDYGKESDYE